MTFDTSLLSMMNDTVTIEPFASETAGRVRTYGTAVTYPAQVSPSKRRVINPQTGHEVESTAEVLIPDRVAVDVRSRLTLPAGFSPQQPPIIEVAPSPVGLGLEYTRIVC